MSETEETEQLLADVSTDDVGKSSSLRPSWMRRPRLRLAIPIAIIGLLVLGVVVYVNRDDGPTPKEKLQRALRLIGDQGNHDKQAEAVQIAWELRKSRYRDSDFAGGTEFILGIAYFRNAENPHSEKRDQRYLIAIRELKKCETLALDESRRPEWAFALGSSLYEIGKTTEARPLLEEAVATYPPRHVEASTRLVDIYLDLKTRDVLLKALPLIDSITKTPGLDHSQYDGAYLRSAQVFLALNRRDDAEEALTHVSDDTQGNQGTIVFRAQTLMAEAESTMAEARSNSEEAHNLAKQAQQAVQQQQDRQAAQLKSQADALADQALLLKKKAEAKYDEAIQQLDPVANDRGLEQTFARQASYLQGVCAAGIGDVDAAINYFEKTADKYADSHEGLAANLRAADLLRRAGRSEEALDKRYRNALQMIKRPEDFRNRWLSLEQFRARIRTAWEEWSGQHAYREAITLSKMMTPLFERVPAFEMTADANRSWAEYLQQKLEKAPYSEREPLQESVHQHWRLSAKAYADLAEEQKATADYSTALRISAEHFHRGHDFENSLRQWTRYINTRPKARLAEAIVSRGKVLMDLDRFDEALEEFQWAIDNYPTDSAAFEAQYVLGTCHLERDKPDLAEKAWREIITSGTLTPAAKQWQLALFSLGRLLYQTAAVKKIKAESPRSKLSEEQTAALLDEAFSRWDESIRRLELFLAFVARDKRHPEAVQAQTEARYLLAKALRHSAELPQRKLESAVTENARLELRRTMQDLLGQARDEYRKLQTELLALEELDMLGELEQRVLRDCFFEVAHTYYALASYGIDSTGENYEKAITAYASAANQYSRDPQVILAYLQISNCYKRLNKPSDARSSLEQAKVILKQMPDVAFRKNSTNMTKAEWKEWLEWVQNLQQNSDREEVKQP